MKRLLLLAALLILVPIAASAQGNQPLSASTLVLTNTTTDSLHVGCAVGAASTTCIGGISGGAIQIINSRDASAVANFVNTSATGSGVAIRGGAGTNFALLVADAAATERFRVAGDGTITASGPINAGVFTATSALIHGPLTVDSTGTFGANVNVAGVMTAGSGVINGNLSVSGNILAPSGSVNISGAVTAANITIQNTAAGQYVGVFNNASTGGHGVLIQASSTDSEHPLHANNYAGTPLWYVTGIGSMVAGADITAGRNMRVNGSASMAAGGTDGNFSVGGVFTVSNKLTMSNTSGLLTIAGGISVSDFVSMNGNLAVGGSSTFAGGVQMNSNLNVIADVHTNNSLRADLDITAGRNVAFAGNTRTGSLNVTGAATIEGNPLQANFDLVVGRNMSVAGNIATSTLSASGVTNLSGGLNVAGAVNLPGATITGTASAPNNYRFAGRNSVVVIIGPSTPTTLTWDTHEVNNGMYNGSGLNIPSTGFYMFGVAGLAVNGANSSDALQGIAIWKNGAQMSPGCGFVVSGPSFNATLTVTCGAQLNAGDTISAVATQTSSTNVNLFYHTELARFWATKIW